MTFSTMPDSNSAALALYEAKQAAADNLADYVEQYREEAIDQLTDEILSDQKRLSDALCESDAVNDGNALDALATLWLAINRKSLDLTDQETDAMELVRAYVRDYVDTWEEKVQDRCYEIAGVEP